MQYFNPYYQQPVQQQYNPLQPQYDRLAQMQAQYNQPTFTQQPSLNGEIVDSVDVVRKNDAWRKSAESSHGYDARAGWK